MEDQPVGTRGPGLTRSKSESPRRKKEKTKKDTSDADGSAGPEGKKKKKKSKSVKQKRIKKKKEKEDKDEEDSGGGIGATSKRITIVYPTANNPANRRLVRMPPSWPALIELCESLIGEGKSVAKISMAPELGGGDIDSIDLIENGDVIYISPAKPQVTPSNASSMTSSQPGSGASSSTHNTSSTKSFSEAPEDLSDTIFGFATDFVGDEASELSLSNLFNVLRKVPEAYKGASTASGPIHVLGYFMAAYEAVYNEHSLFLGGIEGLHRRSEKQHKKQESRYAAKLKGLTPRWAKASGNDFLEQLTPLMDNVTFSDLACGLNLIAAVTAEKKLLLAGPMEVSHVLLTRPKPFEGPELKLLQDKEITPFPANNIKGRVKYAACGAFHCGAVTEDNHLYMWGFNINCSTLGLKGEEVKKQMSQAQPQYTISGQLGLGEGSNKPMAMPTKVTGMTGSILQLACGGAHTLCATSTGVWSWGLNDEGQLGRHENRFVPTPIRGLVGHKIKRVSCGAHHSAAISSEGELFTWGYNEFGQLGIDEARRTVFEPMLIKKFDGKESSDGVPFALAISCGSGHTVMVDRAGRVFSCGLNEFGQLGRRDKKTKSFVACSLPQGAEAMDAHCGPSCTIVNTAAGLVLVTGSLMASRMMTHTYEFRSIQAVEQQDIFASTAYAGQTHVAILEDVLLSGTLKLFKKACSSAKSDFNEEVKQSMLSIAPFFIGALQNRAIHSLHSEDEDSPNISVRCHFVEFGPDKDTQELAFKNYGKKKVNISFDLTMLKLGLPENCSISISPPEGVARSGKSFRAKMVLTGASRGLNSFFVARVASEKGKTPLQIFFHFTIARGMPDRIETKLANYARQQMSANVLAEKDTSHQQDMFSNIDFSSCEVVLLERLGSGGSGAVVNRCTANGLTCAVKIVDTRTTNKRTIDSFLHEISIMQGLRHPAIVRYLGHDVTVNSIRLFMEFYPHSLVSIIQKFSRIGKIPTLEIASIGAKVAEGLDYLHHLNPPIVHRDIKPGNVLVALDAQDHVKLCKITDFDVSREISPGEQAVTLCGTPQYSAPEMLVALEKGYGLEVDIYSYGMVLYELMTLKTPFHGEDHRSITAKLKEGERPPIRKELLADPSYSPLLEIFEQCTNFEPNKRPTAAELVVLMQKIIIAG